MIKGFVYAGFAVLYLLVTFFGLGPVLMADGSPEERGLTLAAVLVLYALLTFGLWQTMKRMNRK